jgi:hypothetical protein
VQPGDVTLPNAFLVLGMIENLRQRQDLVDALYMQGYALAVAWLGRDHEVSRGFTWNALAMQLNSEQEGGQVLPESELFGACGSWQLRFPEQVRLRSWRLLSIQDQLQRSSRSGAEVGSHQLRQRTC